MNHIVDLLCALHREYEPETKTEILQRIERLASQNSINFAYQQERWLTQGDNSSCPICLWLESLGWLPFGSLPPSGKAHSIIGEGRWKAPDTSCRCNKDYRRAAGDSPGAVNVKVLNPHYAPPKRKKRKK